MSFLSDYFTAWQIWRDLTPAQRKAIWWPWEKPHPTVEANLTRLGLWDEHGITRMGAVVAMCRFHPSKGHR